MGKLQVDMGRRIKALRALRGITQQEMQGMTGIAQRYISRYESGKWVAVNPGHLVKMADALDISLDYLTGREDWQRAKIA